MPVKPQTVRSKARRKDKKRPRSKHARKIAASVGVAARELIRADMKNIKATSRALRKFSANGADRRNGARKQPASTPVFKHLKTQLEAAIQRYVDLFEFAPIAYVSFDRVGRIQEINLAAAQLLGGSRARLIGRPFALHVTKEDGGVFLNHLFRCRSSCSRVETELHLKKRNGEIILAHLASSPMTSSMKEGALLYETAIVDLTERERFEENIQRSEERYRTLFDLVTVAVYVCDADGTIQEYNRRASELWGREPTGNGEEPRFCGSYKIYHPDGQLMPHEECPMARTLRGEKLTPKDLEIVVERPDGERRHVVPAPRVLTNKHGKIIGAINCLFDITEHKRAEQHLLVRDAVSRALAECGSLKEAAPRIIQAVCNVAGWEAGALWDVNQATDELYCVDFWHPPSFRVPAFEAASRQVTFRRGIGLPGRVWRNGKPAWVPDVTREDNFPRAPHAVKDGLHAALCFPIKLGNRVLGVVECFSREIREPDNELLQTLASVGSQIGQFVERKKAEQALAETARQQVALYEFSRRHQDGKTLGEIYEAALDAILTALPCDRASILLYDQQRVMRFVASRGLSKKYRKAVEGHSPWKPNAKNPQPVSVADVDLADIPKPLKSTVRSEGISAVAFIPLVAQGKLIGKFMTYYHTPHVFTDNDITLALNIARQLALGIDRKRAEEALRKSEERLRAIINQSNAGIANCDLTGRFLFANRKFREMLGYTDSELAAKTIFTITHPDDVGITQRRFAEMVQKSEPIEIEKRYIRKDGSLFWVNVCDTPVLDSRGKPVSAVAVAIDITERKKAEDVLRKSKQLLEERVRERTRELRAANKGLQDEIARRKGLEGEILEISDREQQRLGQEIHDGLCQHLTAVAFMARSVALRLKNHRVIDASDIEKIAQLVNDAATDTRNLSRALHRIDVDSAGFVTALEDLVDREIWQIPCRLEVKPSFRLEDDVAAGELYRIAREAVINANKHSEAREIVIELEQAGSEMVLRVVDDGIGFPSDLKTKRGLGAHIMSYRARVIGARLEIDSPKGRGTRVSCYVPGKSVQSKRRKNNRTQPLPARIAKALATLV
ncbi:MAG TPA: PAS domain S-box protein [Candidatus Udaeobacter sp.]|nr:PAS domain S-box protein [Candidatus Udaeobacter sp.]